ncbi:MAG: fumarylacetoacetate hydrolase family protein [Muribaculaceae bacterium]|nr:fumarylacetoacetate hydrolase family protein [Muribaculaceae bacterium]
MTIYAIVNDFLQPAAERGIQGPVWTLISPTAILQGGNPYFVPDFASRFEARLALAVRIGKLGKGVAPRFAHRYVDAVAPAVVFAAADRLAMLQKENLPWTSALSYDRALALGKFKPTALQEIPRCECALRLDFAEDADETVYSPAALGPSLEETIEAVSRDNTLKTGDLILIGLRGSGPEVRPGGRATVTLDGQPSIAFNIR